MPLFDWKHGFIQLTRFVWNLTLPSTDPSILFTVHLASNHVICQNRKKNPPRHRYDRQMRIIINFILDSNILSFPAGMKEKKVNKHCVVCVYSTWLVFVDGNNAHNKRQWGRQKKEDEKRNDVSSVFQSNRKLCLPYHICFDQYKVNVCTPSQTWLVINDEDRTSERERFVL